MSIPPFISRTPPPICDDDDDDEDNEIEDNSFTNFIITNCFEVDKAGGIAESIIDEQCTPEIRNEDNTSDDSGFCVGSSGHTQSPCENSPTSQNFRKNIASEIVHDKSKLDLLKNNEKVDSNLDNVSFDEPDHIAQLNDSSVDGSRQNEYSLTFDCPTNDCSSLDIPNSDPGDSGINLKDLEAEFQLEVPLPFDECGQANLLSVSDTSEYQDNLFVEASAILNEHERTLVNSSFSSESNDNIVPSENQSSLDLSSTLESSIATVNQDASRLAEDVSDIVQDDDYCDFTDFQSGAVIEDPFASQTEHVGDQLDFGLDFETPSEIRSLVEEISRNEVWNKLRIIEDSPALHYQWSSSTSNNKLLSSLKIDSRNILYGSSGKILTKVFANDKTPLEMATSVDENEEPSTSTLKESVPDAHFDWIGSGLVNPLDVPADWDHHFSSDNHLQLDSINKESTISDQSEEILLSLPKLSFIKKTYIVFSNM